MHANTLLMISVCLCVRVATGAGGELLPRVSGSARSASHRHLVGACSAWVVAAVIAEAASMERNAT